MTKTLSEKEKSDKLDKRADLSLKIFIYYLIIACTSWLGFVFYTIYTRGSGIQW